jgi:hypothetical protein
MLKSGYQLFKHHAKFIILAGLATGVVQLLLQLIQNGAKAGRGNFVIEILATLFVTLVGIIVSIGWAKVFLKIARGNGAVWNDFKSEPMLWLKFIKVYIWYIGYLVGYVFIAVVLFGIIAVLGKILGITWLHILGSVLSVISFVVAATYFTVRYQFLKYTILDYPELRSREVFKRAGMITKSSLLQLFGFNVTMALVNLLGLVCLVVGLIVSIPTTKIAEVKVYDYLKEKYSA